jgi:hypothetical protein
VQRAQRLLAGAGPKPIQIMTTRSRSSASGAACKWLSNGAWEFGLRAPRAGVPGDMALGAQNKSADREPVVRAASPTCFSARIPGLGVRINNCPFAFPPKVLPWHHLSGHPPKVRWLEHVPVTSIEFQLQERCTNFFTSFAVGYYNLPVGPVAIHSSTSCVLCAPWPWRAPLPSSSY